MSAPFCLFAPTLCMDYFYYYEGNLSLSLDEYIYTPLIMYLRAGDGGDAGTAAWAYVNKVGLCCLGLAVVTAIAVTAD